MGVHSMTSESHLRLAEVLTEVQNRLDELLETGDRVIGVISTILVETSGFDLNQTLCLIAHTAAELVDARYCALGVHGHHHDVTGLSYEDVSYEDIRETSRVRIHPLPDSGGARGMVVDHLEPIGTPNMFLSVPIRIRDEIFGNLYLADKTGGGPFTTNDETFIGAMAAVAGIAIDSARILEHGRLRQGWMDAAREITTELLAGLDMPRVLRLIADKATTPAAGGHCLLIVPRDRRTSPPEATELVVVDSIGSRREGAGEVLAAVGAAAVAKVFADRTPVRLAALDIDRVGSSSPLTGPVLMLPLCSADSVSGVLVTVRPAGSPPFSDELLEMMSAFADQVAVALHVAVAQHRQREQEREQERERDVIAERDRIAANLHEHVIQRLFAVRMLLHGTAAHTGSPDAPQRASEAIEDLQYIAQEIWTAIFDPHPDAVDDTRLCRRLDDAIKHMSGEPETSTHSTAVVPVPVVGPTPTVRPDTVAHDHDHDHAEPTPTLVVKK